MLTQNNECNAVEPGSQVSQCPEENAEFDGINQVLNQKQAPQFRQECVDVCNTDGGNLLGFLLWQSQFEFQVLSMETK